MIRVLPIPTRLARSLREGQPDAYGLPAERGGISTGAGVPCRHCLAQVPQGQPYLIAAYRPFHGINPYTETGPIFLCTDGCKQGGGAHLPWAMLDAPTYILRGYSQDERIVYGSGAVVPTTNIAARCEALLDDPRVAFAHVRSASNNCYFFRVGRG